MRLNLNLIFAEDLINLRAKQSKVLTYKGILRFWLPLAGTWLMMAVEGPYLAAIMARLPDATVNLAAFGVAFACLIIFGTLIKEKVRPAGLITGNTLSAVEAD